MKFAYKLGLGFSVPLALTAILAAVSYVSIDSLKNSSSDVNHTYQVIGQARALESSAVDMETGMRGYLLAGKTEFLEPYLEGKSGFEELMISLKKSVADDPQQLEVLNEIEDTIDSWLVQVIEPSIALRKQVSDELNMHDLANLVGEGKGRSYMDKFRRQIEEFLQSELPILDEQKLVASDETLDVEPKGWTEETQSIAQQLIKELFNAAIEMENGMRGYLLAGKEEFLEPYTLGKSQVLTRVEELSEFVNENPQQVQLLDNLGKTIADWQEKVAEPNIELRRKIVGVKTMDDISDLVGQAKGKQFFDRFREQIATFIEREEALTNERQSKAENVAFIARCSVIAGTGIIILLAATIAFVLIRSITDPIASTVRKLQLVASGDLTQRLDNSRNDELGELATSFNSFVDQLNGIIGNLNQDAIKLNNSSHAMSGVATELAFKTEDANGRTTTVAAAAEQMSTNMNSMAESTERVSVNVNDVANSIGEMTSSISEVANNAENAANIAGEASQLARSSNERIQDLGTAANEIGNVIDVIQDIAEQTNLLALNATIESARAGDAGKGFAVVAGEVKELARQTAAATDDIRDRIQGIQRSTSEAIESVREIGNVIGRINDTSRSIASAVEQQNATTKQIAANVSETAAASEAVSRGVSESANASLEITQNITAVSDVLETTAIGVQKSKESGEAFGQLAQQMEEAFSQFTIEKQTPKESNDASLAG